MLKTGHGLDQARSGLGPAVFFCYTHIFSLFFPGLLRYRSRSRCSRIALSLPGLLVFRLALSGPPSLSASHVAAPALLLSHTHRSICTFLYIFCFPTSSPAGRRPCSPSASRHLGTPTWQSYFLSTNSFKHPLPVTRSTAGPTARSPHLPGLLDARTGSIILRSPRPHRSLDQTWMSRLWSCLSSRVSSLLFWSPGEPPLPPATKVSGWRRWLQR